MFSIYHNPRCSKSRQALSLLEEKGISPEVILYLEKMPSKELIELMLAYPKVIERPIIIKGDRAVIGRPPEALLDLL